MNDMKLLQFLVHLGLLPVDSAKRSCFLESGTDAVLLKKGYPTVILSELYIVFLGLIGPDSQNYLSTFACQEYQRRQHRQQH